MFTKSCIIWFWLYKVLHTQPKTTKCAMVGEKPNTIYLLLASFSLTVWLPISILHEVISCWTEVVSAMNTSAFLAFQSCQHDKAMNIPNSCCGRLLGRSSLWSSRTKKPGGTGTPIFIQYCLVGHGHPLTICSGVSSCSPQTSQMAEGTLCLRWRIWRHWILPCVR